jgi:energy-converting hydrogenase Eha subunit A
MNDNNPYSPPKSDVTPPPAPVTERTLLPEPRSLPAGAGINWLSQGWPLVKNNLGVWVLLTLTLLAIQIVFSALISPFTLSPVLPVIIFFLTVISTVLSAGIMLGAQSADSEQGIRFEHLFAGFKGLFKPLASLGVVAFCISQILEFLIRTVLGIDINAVSAGTLDPATFFDQITAANIAIIVILYLLTTMLFWFSTPLVALNNVPVFQSLSMSFKACLRNPLPLLIYCIAAMVLIILGAIPLALGLLVVVPWLFSSMYTAYKQIFLQ